MDRPLSSAQLRRQVAGRLLRVSVPIVFVAALLVWGPGWIRPSVSRNRIRTARVDVGPIEAVITASGTVVPEVEQVVPSPVDARVLRILKRPGDTVKKGDPILELDLQGALLAVAKLNQDVALKENQQAKTRLDLETRLNDLESQREIKSLQLEALRAQLARSRDLFKEGLLSREVLGQAELAESQAAVELKKVEADARTARASNKTHLDGLALEMATLERERSEARRQLDLATTKADRAGVVTSTVTEEGVSVRKGDLLARIADLGSFRVDATVSDIHAQRLATGMPVVVKISESASIEGYVSSIHPTIREGVMTFSVTLADKSSTLLRSNLRVDVLVVMGRKARAPRLKRGPFADGESLSSVFVVQAGRAVRTPVRLGMSSFDQIEVEEGLREGDEVIISDMSECAHLRELRIR